MVSYDMDIPSLVLRPVTENDLGRLVVRMGGWTKNLPNIPMPTGVFFFRQQIYTTVKVDGATPKRWRIVRGHGKPMELASHRSFPGGIIKL